MTSNPRQEGFTLIELMIVVAVIAILASIALPSYTRYVQKSRRSAAEACLLGGAQYMERYYTTNMKYSGAALSNAACTSDTSTLYAYSLTSDDTTYTVKATPGGAQAGDSCGTLSVTETGAKSPTTSGCW